MFFLVDVFCFAYSNFQNAILLRFGQSFILADTQIYERLFPSVGPSVRLTVRWSVTIESKSVRTRIYGAAVYFL